MAAPWQKYAAPAPEPKSAPWVRYAGKETVAKTAPSVGEDVLSSIPSALGRVPFVIAGMPGDALGLGMEAGRWIDENVLGNPVRSREEVAAGNPLGGITSDALESMYEGATGTELYDPLTNTGRVASSTITGAGAGAALGTAATGLGGAIPGAAAGGGSGLGGEAARQKTEGTKWEFPASVAGAFAGGAGGGLATAGVRRLITPRNVPPQNAAAADVLRREGIGNLTEGQITQSKRTLAAERSRLGNSGDARRVEQLEQLTSAALRRAGVNANRATPDVIDQAFADIGNRFNTYSARNVLAPDQQFANDIRGAVNYYADRVSAPNRAPLIGNYLKEIQSALSGGQITGQAYQSLRSRIQADARGMMEPTAKRTLFDLADALDSGMERSIGRSNPQDLGGFKEARRLYRNILVIEDAATRGGSDAALGLITPGALRSATKQIHGKRNMARGQGDFEELSRAAAGIMTELPLTGTAPLRMPSSLADANILAMPFKAIGMGVNALRMTPWAQQYLTNRLMPPPGRNPVAGSLLPSVPGANMATKGPYRTGGSF